VSRQLAPVAGARPIHLGLIAFEHLVPIRRLAAGGSLPKAELFGMVTNFKHVVAGPKAKLFEGELQGVRSGSAKSGPYYLQSYFSLRRIESIWRKEGKMPKETHDGNCALANRRDATAPGM
jgi:hypothetical protein